MPILQARTLFCLLLLAVALTFVTDQLVLMPAWSPDGSRIVFSADFRTMGQNSDLYVVDAATSRSS